MDVLGRIREEIRELLLNHGGSIRTDMLPKLYLERYGKPLTMTTLQKRRITKPVKPTRNVDADRPDPQKENTMADPQLRAMIRSEYNNGPRTFLAFAAQYLVGIVEFRPTSDAGGSDALVAGGSCYLLGAGGAARLPVVLDPITGGEKLLQIKREIRELLLEHGGSVRHDEIAPLYLARFGKSLSTLNEMADPQLLNRTKGRGNAKNFRAFAYQHLKDVVDFRPMTHAFHLVGWARDSAGKLYVKVPSALGKKERLAWEAKYKHVMR